MDNAAESAEWWDKLADEATKKAAYERSIGIDASGPGQSVGDYQAATYRKSAQALRLEASTGIPHCTYCLGPHANHEHK